MIVGVRLVVLTRTAGRVAVPVTGTTTFAVEESTSEVKVTFKSVDLAPGVAPGSKSTSSEQIAVGARSTPLQLSGELNPAVAVKLSETVSFTSPVFVIVTEIAWLELTPTDPKAIGFGETVPAVVA